ncbi:hypothetical protein ACAW74_12965 [Fibrella sp. WM1]|uniref:hypothetical protein n=1 Tax=Fibrella musci TaxID=3242485 RepID=UPI003521DF21
MKKNLLLLVCLLLTLTTTVSFAQTKKATKKVEVEGKKVARARGANPNIKMDEPTVDKPVPQPAKSRGAACSIHFDNRTGLYIRLYVDGNYKGTMEPWGDRYVTVGDGYTTIYCVSTGGSREWNASGDCREAYDYTLR